MSTFRAPTVTYGRRTLAGIVLILVALLSGIAYLATAYELGAMDQTQPMYRSELSQLAAAVAGEGIFFYVAIGSLLSVLALSANTSFVDFPRLCRAVASDGFLPRPFAIAGQRLVFSIGILYLAVTGALLLVAFGGITEHLIPPFAVGAFSTFSLSQAGMVFHWRQALHPTTDGRERCRIKAKLTINAIGAAATTAALMIIIAASFKEGAWITVIVVPAVILLLKRIRMYYDRLEACVRDPQPLDLDGLKEPILLVAIEDWNQLADRAVAFALVTPCARCTPYTAGRTG